MIAQDWFLFQALFSQLYITTLVLYVLISFSAVQTDDLSYNTIHLHSYYLPVGSLIAQVVEHSTSIAEAMSSNLVQASFFLGYNFTAAWVVYI